jgi:tetratricopeptide (TPR) repeat protein
MKYIRGGFSPSFLWVACGIETFRSFSGLNRKVSDCFQHEKADNKDYCFFMAQNHYQTLGVSAKASQSDIKSAYRKIVLAHHPDKSSSASSAAIFLAATEAYESLGTSEARRDYDQSLERERQRLQRRSEATTRQTQKQQPSAPSPKAQTIKTVTNTISEELTRLTIVFNRGNSVESERIARDILSRDNRQPVPYAVLGDIARGRGDYEEASKMYAFAVQMAPRNPLYQQLHEEIMTSGKVRPKAKTARATEESYATTVLVSALLIVSAAVYIILAKEMAFVPGLPLVSTWTLGLAVMLFLGGVTIGAALSACNQLDRLQTNSMGRISSPLIALTSVAVVNFWAALSLYAGISLAQRGWTLSHAKFVGGIAFVTLLLGGVTTVSASQIQPGQALLWGGNIVYIGGMCGWFVADSFKRI